MSYRPLRVWCDLAEPVVYFGDGMHLDGILAMAAFRDLPRAETDEWPDPIVTGWARDLDLPLARWALPYEGECHPQLRDASGLVWGWCASAVHADWGIHTRTEVRKKTAVDEMARWTEADDVDIAGFRFKSKDAKFPAKVARRLEWYVVGDPVEIERLLSEHITGVGKLCAQGHGRVLRWRVDEWAHDWSVSREGRPTRVLPAQVRTGRVGVARVRAPYSHASREVVAVKPEYQELRP